MGIEQHKKAGMKKKYEKSSLDLIIEATDKVQNMAACYESASREHKELCRQAERLLIQVAHHAKKLDYMAWDLHTEAMMLYTDMAKLRDKVMLDRLNKLSAKGK